MNSTLKHGVLVHWNYEDCYGFLHSVADGKSVYLHISHFVFENKIDRDPCIVAGGRYSFQEGVDKYGRPAAINVECIENFAELLSLKSRIRRKVDYLKYSRFSKFDRV